MIKHALISSREKWNALRPITSLDGIDWIPAVRESVLLKNRIVNADFRDRHQRKTLNFGHTIGHALESYSLRSHPDPLKHGEAVALGMIGELFLSEQHVHLPAATAAPVIDFLSRHYGHLCLEFDKAEVLEHMKSDKKNEGAQIKFVLLTDIGHPLINQQPGEELIYKAMDFIFEHIRKPALQS
jgi:3-dehydroquinate synthase